MQNAYNGDCEFFSSLCGIRCSQPCDNEIRVIMIFITTSFLKTHMAQEFSARIKKGAVVHG